MYNQAIQLLGDKTHVHQLYYNLGLAWKKKGQSHRAFEMFCKSYVDNPQFEKAYLALAALAREQKSRGVAVPADLMTQIRTARDQSKAPAGKSDLS